MNPLIQQFIHEARELLEEAGASLLALERTPGDADLINRVFRGVHTLKGNAGFFEFKPISVAVHAGEDLLDAVRDGRLELDADMMDSLLMLCDTVGGWVAEIAETGVLDPGHVDHAVDVAARLSAHGGARVASSAAAAPVAVDAAPVPVDWIQQFDEAALMQAWSASSGRPLCLGTYTPDAACFFSGDDPCLTLLGLPGLVASTIEFNRALPALDTFDPYDCNLRLHFACAAPLDDVRDKLRFVIEQVGLRALSPAVLLQPRGLTGQCEAGPALAVELLNAVDEGTWDELTAVVDAALPTLAPQTLEASLLRWLRCVIGTPRAGAAAVRPLIRALELGCLPAGGLLDEAPAAPSADPRTRAFWAIVQAHADRLQQIGTAAADDERLPPVRHAVQMAVTGLGDSTRLAAWQAACKAADAGGGSAALGSLLQRWLADPLADSGAAAAAAAQAAAASQDAMAASALSAGSGAPVSTMVRVEQEKLDRLMDLIGEMVVAKNSLPYLAQRAAEVFGNVELAREIKERHAVIHRIAQDMQNAIMQVRMMPVSQVLQRFPRVVRDLARRLGKDVQLDISGEDTEADKNIIEAMADPLVHLLRNAVDHGIELPSVRMDAGKSGTGTVRIHAWQDSDQVCIEIADDGHGVDPARVKRKAVEKGVISEEQAQAMTDEAAVQLIFAAGFSTAEVISDVSGRGVGMDVVRSSVERIGGRVTLSSTLGQGSCVRLSLPLSMAVAHIMGFKVGGQRFGIAMDRVMETLRVPISRLFCLKHQEALVLRERLVPIHRMRGLLGLPERAAQALALNGGGAGAAEPDPELAVLVVRVNGEPVGLVIDEFDEGIETIIKPLEGVLGALPGLTGTALLGDGSVLLVVDPGALL